MVGCHLSVVDLLSLFVMLCCFYVVFIFDVVSHLIVCMSLIRPIFVLVQTFYIILVIVEFF